MQGLPDAEVGRVADGMAPKLDILLSASPETNIATAEQSASVATRPRTRHPRARGAARTRRRSTAARIAPEALGLDARALRGVAAATSPPFPPPPPEVPRDAEPVREVDYSLFVQLEGDLDPDVREAAIMRIRDLAERSRWKRDTAAVEVERNNAGALRKIRGVSYVEPGQALRVPEPILGEESRGRGRDTRRIATLERRHRNGRDVLVGVIDVGGFDFAHRDFADASGQRTRWVAIWDQGGTSRPSPANSRRRERFAGLDYGTEILKTHMDAALEAAPKRGISPTALEPQSVMVAASHGTHVASIAAGNRGVAREAHIAGVLVALRPEDILASSSFYDSTRIVDAVDYLLALAADLGGDDGPLPVAINISLGTNGHAHDTSSAMARWMDNALSTPGRCISVAAGNAGQVEPESPTDRGYIVGRIHASGTFAATNLQHELGWVVGGDGGVEDVSDNELEIWYGPQDRIDVEVRPPGSEWIGPIRPTQKIANKRHKNGTSISIHSETYYPANGLNRISIVLSPSIESSTGTKTPIKSGEWRVRLTGTVVRDGRYDAWIERDDPHPAPAAGPRAWRYPSFFAPGTYTADRMISSLACAERILSVANVDLTCNAAHVTSSRGPTRDGRFKPDIAADGTGVVAAKGFDGRDKWVAMTGTSMASPYVCGVAALMLGVAPKLTSAQILGIVRTTSKPLPGHDFCWRNDTGFGVVDAADCVREAAAYVDVPADSAR